VSCRSLYCVYLDKSVKLFVCSDVTRFTARRSCSWRVWQALKFLSVNPPKQNSLTWQTWYIRFYLFLNPFHYCFNPLVMPPSPTPNNWCISDPNSGQRHLSRCALLPFPQLHVCCSAARPGRMLCQREILACRCWQVSTAAQYHGSRKGDCKAMWREVVALYSSLHKK